MSRGKLVVIILGAAGFVVGCMEWQLKTVAKDIPRSISAAQLVSQGYGDNAHVVVTGISLCDNFVYEEKRGRWTQVWVPAVPAGQPCGGNIRLIVKDSSARNEGDVAMIGVGGTVQGVIINKIASLGGEEKRLLEETYGPMSNVYVLQHNRGTWPAMGVIGIMGVGGFVFILGLALTAADMQKR